MARDRAASRPGRMASLGEGSLWRLQDPCVPITDWPRGAQPVPLGLLALCWCPAQSAPTVLALYPWRVRLTTHGPITSSEARTATVDEAGESPRGEAGRPDSLFPVDPSSAPASPTGTANGAPPGTHTGLPWRETRWSPGGVPSSLAWSPRPRDPAPFTGGTPSTGTHAESDSPGACPGPATEGHPSERPAESKEARGATHARVPGSQRRILRLVPGRAHHAATSPPPPSAGPHLPRPRHREGDQAALPARATSERAQLGPLAAPGDSGPSAGRGVPAVSPVVSRNPVCTP